MKNKRRGMIMMLTGLLLVAAALFLAVSNLREQSAADASAQSVMGTLHARIPDAEHPPLTFALPDGAEISWPADESGAPEPWPVDANGLPLPEVQDSAGNTHKWPLDASGAPVWDIFCAEKWSRAENGALLPWISDGAGNIIPWPSAAGELLSWKDVQTRWRGIIASLLPYLDYAEIPYFVKNPGMEMPVTEVDGRYYIGYLSIPSLELELPVMTDWSYPDLRVAPCRYSGSVYSKDIVIAGHNYERHFGRLDRLTVGSEVRFTDADGNIFVYVIERMDVLAPTAVMEMTSGEWDLTLFTCTYGGTNREAVRCTMESYIAAAQ